MRQLMPMNRHQLVAVLLKVGTLGESVAVYQDSQKHSQNRTANNIGVRTYGTTSAQNLKRATTGTTSKNKQATENNNYHQ
eukprot:2570868-Amphidinium_carterae.1